MGRRGSACGGWTRMRPHLSAIIHGKVPVDAVATAGALTQTISRVERQSIRGAANKEVLAYHAQRRALLSWLSPGRRSAREMRIPPFPCLRLPRPPPPFLSCPRGVPIRPW
ncbi:unnamed protein product [Prorocentrum cordatum]|uniref:Uncharacterized protein n=1 Tax=Prorocentrum cordatum TaxID=2364126 RepID=A0ABN9VBL3_9DINO|nr:unnamed protein product [Polarella glacialis]